MPKVCDITFEFEELADAEYDANAPRVSRALDELLRRGPSFARCPHHGIYNFHCTTGAFNTIRIERTGLFVIMHDGDQFDLHPLVRYLESELPRMFSAVEFH